MAHVMKSIAREITKLRAATVLFAVLSCAFIATAPAVAASGNDILDQLGAPPGDKSASVSGSELSATITPSATHAAAGQQLSVSADVTIAPGWHVYGRPLPAGYVPASIVLDNDLVAQQSFQFPKPQMVTFEGLGETVPVYKGNLKAKGKILLRSGLKAGEYRLSGKLNFQECSDQICKLPQSLAFEMPFTIDAPK